MYAQMDKQRAHAPSAHLVDLRSDTVTRPSEGMRQAMATAEVGDDVYGEDPTLNRLEAVLAERSGKEAGLFLPSGSQSNLIALLSHCNRGQEYLAGTPYHIFSAEAGGAAVLGGISPWPLTPNETGGLSVDQVLGAIKPDDPHSAITKLLSLENTVSGQVQPQDEIVALAEAAKSAGLSVHLDGARLFNAAVAQNLSLEILCAPVDTVSLCLSKGLGAPVGSVLVGPKDFIHLARRNRKLVGGGMRQAGILGAACLYALEHNVDRLADDHANAQFLADELSKIPQIRLGSATAATNMLFMGTSDPADLIPLCRHLGEKGFVLGLQEPFTRVVVHLDVTREDLQQMVDLVAAYFRN
ncbi:low-specificity L-threonine aldolase [Rhodovibrionaceae bacterium A322]